MDHDQAVKLARRMMAENPDYCADAKVGARVGNSVIGSLLSLLHGMPRQYAEAAVRDALRARK